jgi:PilZ domain
MSDALSRSMQLDARREPRFAVHWRGRMQLPDARVIEMRLKDISESGMGMTAAEAVPSGAMFEVSVRVPDPGGSAQMTEVTGTVKIAYVAMRGYEFSVGVVWVDRDDAGRELMSRWIGRLRYRL